MINNEKVQRYKNQHLWGPIIVLKLKGQGIQISRRFFRGENNKLHLYLNMKYPKRKTTHKIPHLAEQFTTFNGGDFNHMTSKIS